MSDNEMFVNDAELAVLSLIIKDADLAYKATDLKPFMFSSSIHRRLFSEIESFIERQLIPEPHLLISSLGADDSLDSVGGDAFIYYLMELGHNPENFQEYVDVVVNAYKTRSLVQIGANFKAESIKRDSVDDFIQEARGQLDRLMETSGGSSTVHIGSGASDVFESIVARRENPGIRGHSWGLGTLDSVSGGKSEGDMWIIGGRPGSGKTAAVCNSILVDARNGVPSLLIEKEMNFQSLVERLLAIDLGIPISNIRQGILSQEEIDMIFERLKEFKKFPIYIDTNYSSSVSYLESVIRKYRSTKGIEVVYLDSVQLLAERNDNQTHALGRISRKFKLLANELDMTTVMISQLSRSVETRDNKRPILSDLRQSGNLEEDADYVVGLYRDDYYNADSKYKGTMEYIILKNRNGPVGTLPMKFEAPTNKIKDMR